MKSITKTAVVVGLMVLSGGATAASASDDGNCEHNWTGTLKTIDAQQKTLTATHWLATKTFILGDKCAISTIDKKEAPLGDLRSGEKINVHYQDVKGVLVADRIAEKAFDYNGTVRRVDKQAKTITMEVPPLYQPFSSAKTFHLALDCKLVRPDGSTGTLADVQPGDQVFVVYDFLDRSPVAYRVRDNTLSFVGTMQSMDPAARKLTAKKGSGAKQFDLAEHCQIALPDDKVGHFKDLAPGQQYRFTYQQVNGVAVLDRIAPVGEPAPAQTASAR